MTATRINLLGRSWPSQIAPLATLAHPSAQQRDPVKDFCRRFGHQTAVVDRKLYIDGGLVNWKPMETDPRNYTNSWLVWHDLDAAPQGMPPMHVGLSKNDTIPSVHGGALWADDVNYRLFLFGGEFYGNNPTTSSMMSYDIWYDQWDDFGPPSEGIQRVSYGASTSVMERGEGYYYGGYLSNASVPGWNGRRHATSDLVRYQMDGNSWTKLAGPDDIRRAEGVMTFIPASDGGMLVYFGGVQDPYRNGTMIPQPMEQIFLYDIISDQWHVQKANGTIPEYRRRFCAGAVWAKDRSSYNIYLNAGLGFGGYGFDDVYVLSLPSFEWIKIYPLDRNGTGDYPSHSLSCNTVNDGSQMLTIGGSFPKKNNTCDSDQVWGVHNVDLGNQIKGDFKKVWVGYMPTFFGYKVPHFLTSVIGGTKDGGATKTTPDAGFADHDIGILLGMKATFLTRTRANDGRNNPVTATTVSEDPGSKPGLSRGAIIGIAVGGGVVLLVLVGLWLIIRKHKRKANTQSVAPTEPLVQTLPTTTSSFSPYYDAHPPSEMDGQDFRMAELGVGN